MKKKILVLATAFLMTISATFAQNNQPVPDAISTALQQDFKGAEQVQWKTTGQFYKANFTLNGQAFEAFYSIDGQKIGVSRKIVIEQLPMSLAREAKEKAASSQVTDLFELLTEHGTEYFITLKNDKETKTFQSKGEYWTRY